MKTFTCQCGCGQTDVIKKYWRKPYPPQFIQGHNINVNTRKEPVKQDIPPLESHRFTKYLTDDQLLYLKGHYRVMERNKLAKRLNISKWLLNFVVMELGLKKEGESA